MSRCVVLFSAVALALSSVALSAAALAPAAAEPPVISAEVADTPQTSAGFIKTPRKTKTPEPGTEQGQPGAA
ncbi:hypothetical protein [Actinophytocola sediminis]